MSHPGQDAFENWVEANQADLYEKFILKNHSQFYDYCYQLWVNQFPEREQWEDR